MEVARGQGAQMTGLVESPGYGYVGAAFLIALSGGLDEKKRLILW